MSVDALELLIIVIGAILIIGSIWESLKMLLRHVEANRERWRRDRQGNKWREVDKNK